MFHLACLNILAKYEIMGIENNECVIAITWKKEGENKSRD